MSPDFQKLATAATLTFVCSLFPLLLSASRHRTRILLYGYFFALTILPFLVRPSFTMFFEQYALQKGIVRGLDFFLADFMLVALVIDRLIDRTQPVRWLPRGSHAWGFLIGAMLLSLPDAYEKNLTLFETLKFLKGATIFWVLANIGATRRGLHMIVDAIVLATAGVILNVVFERLQGNWQVTRYGFTIHKNIWSLFVNLLAPVTIALCFYRFRSIIFRGSFLIGVLALSFLQKASESRGGQACFAISLVVIIGLSLLCRKRTRFAGLQLILLLVVLVGGFVHYFDEIQDRWRQGLVDDQTYVSGRRETMTERREMREHCWQIIEEHPLNGIGLGNYCFFWFERGYYRTMAHHLYLLMLAETGILGLLAFCYFLGYWIWLSIRTLSAGLPPPLMAVAIGMPAVFIVPMVHGLVEYNLRDYICFVTYAIMTGLVAGLRDAGSAPGGGRGSGY